MWGRLTNEADQLAIVCAVTFEGVDAKSAWSLLESLSLPPNLRRNWGVIRRTLIHFETFGEIRRPKQKLRRVRWSRVPDFIRDELVQFLCHSPELYVDEIAVLFARQTGLKLSESVIEKILLSTPVNMDGLGEEEGWGGALAVFGFLGREIEAKAETMEPVGSRRFG